LNSSEGGLGWADFAWPLPAGNTCTEVNCPGARDDTHSLAPGKYVCYIVMDGRIFGPQSLLVE